MGREQEDTQLYMGLQEISVGTLSRSFNDGSCWGIIKYPESTCAGRAEGAGATAVRVGTAAGGAGAAAEGAGTAAEGAGTGA